MPWPVEPSRPSLEDAAAQGAWLETQRERFEELHQQLLAKGWRPAGRGAHWWSSIYRRPDLDWDTPPDAGLTGRPQKVCVSPAVMVPSRSLTASKYSRLICA
jgi:hypothetical protein